MGMTLEKFEPGSLIEITDTMTGVRKIGVVTAGGDMYFDEIGGTATPFPIYTALKPVAIGNALSWALELAGRDPEQHKQFAALQVKLLAGNLDTLTLARTLHWAYSNNVFEHSRALAAGRAATKQVQESRALMDRLVGRAAAA